MEMEGLKSERNHLIGDFNWIDCTSFFDTVCNNDMETGQIIHGEGFSLYDTMSSCEMMDPKMDPTFNSKDRVLSIEERIQRGLLPMHNIPLVGIVEAMDQMLCAEVTILLSMSHLD
jgi:hypothetical protein